MSEGVPQLRQAVGSTVVPGDRIASVRSVAPASGTYAMAGIVYAAAAGRLVLNKVEENGSYSVSVEPPNQGLASAKVLSVGQIIIGRVARITNQQAVVTVSATSEGVVQEPHEGVIRREDVRSGASEQVKMMDSFRPGDYVVARIVAQGDVRRYFLSTAEPELGVLLAVSSTSGKPMISLSSKEMGCQDSPEKELRKCARPRNMSKAVGVASTE